MPFTFIKVAATLNLPHAIHDPYLFLRLRQPFLDGLRRILCKGSTTCERCSNRHECPYHELVGQELAVDPAVRRHQKPSLPFAFQLPPVGEVFADSVEIGLVLAGRAVNHASAFISALYTLQVDDTAVVSVHSLDLAGGRLLLPRNPPPFLEGLSLFSESELLLSSSLPPDRIKLKITTPLRLTHDGRVLRRFDVSLFLRTLLRRISSVAAYYGEEMHADYSDLAARSNSIVCNANELRWVCVSAEREGRYDGILGTCVLEGDLVDFHPFLLLGQEFHLGKGAVFGFGGFQVGLPP
jgi:hypothetical protein